MSQRYDIVEDVARANFMTVEELESTLPDREDLDNLNALFWTSMEQHTLESWRAYLEAKAASIRKKRAKQAIEGREN